jgi:starvation-inducible DNA-binding protein
LERRKEVAQLAALKVPAEDLSQSRREWLIDDLNGHLAHLIDLAASAKQAHWNVRGPNFGGLHGLFDEIAAEAREYSDRVAERAVALGGIARGSMDVAATRTTLGPFPSDVTEWRRLTHELHDRVLAVAAGLRSSVDALDDEKVTQDLYIGSIDGLEKRAWMLRAHVQE